MSIAATLQKHFTRKHIDYDLIRHPPTADAMSVAEACHVSADRLAKGVVLRTNDSYILAVLPASRRICRADLKVELGENFVLATEREIDELFADCAHGAIPPIGECYGLDALVEDSIRDRPDIYFEGGDHTTLVHMTQIQFAQLMEHARHGRFAADA
jgi:Ala-tRNA(Pro) deacylase